MKSELIENTKLNKDEQKLLERLIKVVDQHGPAFVAVGLALKEIQEKRLYRATHKSFAAFTLEHWGYEKSYAHRLITAADVQEKLVPIGTAIPEAKTITRESQLRELKNVPGDKLEEVVERAAAIASDAGTPITAAVLREAKKERPVSSAVIDATSTPIPAKTEQSKPEAPPASIVLDLLKREVPEALRDKYAVGTELAALGRKFDAIKREVEQFRGVDGADFLPIQTIEIALHDLKGLVTQSAYWTACPRCSGKGCSRCDGTGYLPKSRKGKLSHEDKEILGL